MATTVFLVHLQLQVAVAVVVGTHQLEQAAVQVEVRLTLILEVLLTLAVLQFLDKEMLVVIMLHTLTRHIVALAVEVLAQVVAQVVTKVLETAEMV
jgi:hypothetical protein